MADSSNRSGHIPFKQTANEERVVLVAYLRSARMQYEFESRIRHHITVTLMCNTQGDLNMAL